MFTPGTQPDRVAKMLAAGTADTLVIDWEDAVAPPDKARARQATRDAWGSFPASRTERAIRVNPAGTEWHAEDVRAALALTPDALVLPKAERAEDVARLGAPGVTLLLILESGRGALDALAIAQASDRVDALIFGAEDYAADVGGRRRRDNLDVLWARSRVAAVAAAVGVPAVDQVFVDFHDAAGLKAEAEQARDIGYRGKMVIHPNQIPVVNEAFTPSVAEIAHATRVLQAAAAAEKEGKGAFALDGKMVDAPLLRQARLVLEIARAAGRVP
jgi:citrate lyase beta subunit